MRKLLTEALFGGEAFSTSNPLTTADADPAPIMVIPHLPWRIERGRRRERDVGREEKGRGWGGGVAGSMDDVSGLLTTADADPACAQGLSPSVRFEL